MPENLGPQPEIPANAVPTADGTSPEAPASDNSTTTTPPVQPQQRLSKVAGVEDYERELSQALAPAPAVEEAEPGTPAEQPPADSVPDGPEADAEPPVETPAATDQPPKKEFRPRLNGIKDPQTQEAILLVSSLAAEGKPITLAEAERRIALKYGAELPAAAGEQPAAPAETPEEYAKRTPEEIAREAASLKEQIASLKEQRKQAIRDLDPDKQIEIEDKIDLLRDEHAILESQTQKAELTAQQEFDRKVDESHQQAAGIYPVMVDENHAIHAKATEIWANLEKTRNPLIHDENAPLRVYQMAANDLGIAPSDPGTVPAQTLSPKAGAKPPSTPATPKPQAVPVSAVRRPTPGVNLPSGSSATTQNGPPADPLGKISTVHDYDKALENIAG